MAQADFSITQGEDFGITLNVQDDNGNPVDLTGYDIESWIKFRFSDTVSLANFDAQIADPTGGIITLALNHTGTILLPITTAFYDVRTTDDSGIVSIPLNGKIFVNPSVSD